MSGNCQLSANTVYQVNLHNADQMADILRAIALRAVPEAIAAKIRSEKS
jgi:hypothetical protein